MSLIDLGEYLKKRREQLNLGQVDIARISGIDISSIGRVENGERFVSRPVVPNLARAYQTPLFTILGLVYNDGADKLEKENIIPLLTRIVQARIENFSLIDLGELQALEREMGFPFTGEQILAWYKKRLDK
jgi:transcriptional regulator with XRE-family HTH domain